ncbi:Chloroperoxidase [Aspergillus varians]
MKATLISLTSLLGLASASSHLNVHLHLPKNPHDWLPAGPDDGTNHYPYLPCPMLNTLANHNHLPHDGRNITRPVLANALVTALNFDPTLASEMFGSAIRANPDEGATAVDLDQMNVHNLVEHDASLSRADAYFGNNHLFDPTVFAQTRLYWTEPILTTSMLANSKLARQLHSKAFNPTYTYPEETEETSHTEAGFPIIAFGDIEKGTVERRFVEYFFENERLPIALGWRVRDEPVTAEQLGKVGAMIGEAVKLGTGSAKSSK